MKEEMIIENYVEEEREKTVAELYREAAGKSVSLDFFLFSCLERKETLGTIKPKWRTANSWSDLETEGATTDKLKGLKEWASKTFPILSTNDPLDHEIIGDYVDATVRVANEFEKLVARPKFKKEELAASIAEAFADMPFIKSYLSWISKETVEKTLDLTSVPPQGKYAYLLRKQLQKITGRRDTRGGRSTGGKGRDDNRNRNSNKSSAGGNSNNRNRTDNKKGGRPDRNRGPSKGPSKGPNRSEHSGEEQKREAINDAKNAISQLTKDTKVGEILLKPRNSFLRRLQHQHISENGYISNSTGEGRQRTIKISRK